MRCWTGARARGWRRPPPWRARTSQAGALHPRAHARIRKRCLQSAPALLLLRSGAVLRLYFGMSMDMRTRVRVYLLKNAKVSDDGEQIHVQW